MSILDEIKQQQEANRSSERLVLYVPRKLKDRITKAANDIGISYSTFVRMCVERALKD